MQELYTQFDLGRRIISENCVCWRIMYNNLSLKYVFVLWPTVKCLRQMLLFSEQRSDIDLSFTWNANKKKSQSQSPAAINKRSSYTFSINKDVDLLLLLSSHWYMQRWFADVYWLNWNCIDLDTTIETSVFSLKENHSWMLSHFNHYGQPSIELHFNLFEELPLRINIME